MLNQAQKLLKQYYGYEKFRDGQTEIITSIMSGKDTLAIMPTGAGKSMCFQIPALLFKGVTLVISPLISLMKDQVDDLTGLGITAAYINSSLDANEVSERISKARQGKFKLIYIAPERLESERFWSLLKNLDISFIAVDEAHCVSAWGHDFRPSYKSIAPFINSLSKKPSLGAFTATATKAIRQDIISLLTLKQPNVYIAGFNRENLFFSVFKDQNKLDFVRHYAAKHSADAGIIYAATRKEVDNVYEELRRCGFSVGRYHAGMTDQERTEAQDAFTYDNIKIIIATNAFGMGIDKSNVRYVIHYNMPKSMEAYYQEAGRAGRDGDPGECIILYSPQDVRVQKYLIEHSDTASPERRSYDYQRLQDMVDYSYTGKCLRKYILNYFEESSAPDYCGNCGNCQDGLEVIDITIEAKKILSCVLRMKESYGISLVADVLKGSRREKVLTQKFNLLSTYGILKDKPRAEIKNLINYLVAEGYLAISDGEYPIVGITQKALGVLRGQQTVSQRLIQKRAAPELEAKPAAGYDTAGLFESLKTLRRQIAFEQGVPPYIVFADSALKDMCQKLPFDMDSFCQIKGVGQAKAEKYGESFLKIITEEMVLAGIQQPSGKNIKTELSPLRQFVGQLNSDRSEDTPSHLITWQMHNQGLSLESITEKRNLKPATIQNHLARCHSEGYAVNWDEFIPEKFEAEILAAVEQAGSDRLRPVKEILDERLNEKVSYLEILAVILKHSQKGEK